MIVIRNHVIHHPDHDELAKIILQALYLAPDISNILEHRPSSRMSLTLLQHRLSLNKLRLLHHLGPSHPQNWLALPSFLHQWFRLPGPGDHGLFIE